MIEVSAGIICVGPKILCLQRRESKYPYISHKYEFPGGKIESGEKPIEALVRELSEELKVDTSNCDIESFCVTEHNYPDFSVKLHFFIVKAKSFDYILTEHINARWLTVEELDDVDWAEADKAAVGRLKGIL